MRKNSLFISLLPLLLIFLGFSSCKNNLKETGSVTFSIRSEVFTTIAASARAAADDASGQSSSQDWTVSLTLYDDNDTELDFWSVTKSEADLKSSGEQASFEVSVGTVVYAKSVIELDGSDVRYAGVSERITVTEGENRLPLTLKKVSEPEEQTQEITLKIEVYLQNEGATGTADSDYTKSGDYSTVLTLRLDEVVNSQFDEFDEKIEELQSELSEKGYVYNENKSDADADAVKAEAIAGMAEGKDSFTIKIYFDREKTASSEEGKTTADGASPADGAITTGGAGSEDEEDGSKDVAIPAEQEASEPYKVQMVLYGRADVSTDVSTEYSYYLTDAANGVVPSTADFTATTDSFCFDNDGNFYVLNKNDTKYTIKSNNKKWRSQESEVILDLSSIQATAENVSVTVEKKTNTLYVSYENQTTFVVCKYPTLVSDGSVNQNTTVENRFSMGTTYSFYPLRCAVYDGRLYLIFVDKAADSGSNEKYYVAEGTWSEEKSSSNSPVSLEDVKKELELKARLSGSAEITDMIYKDGAVYALLRDYQYGESSGEIVSRGALIKYTVADESGSVELCGWNENLAGTDVSDKVFFGPQKFIAAESESGKLFVADYGLVAQESSEGAAPYENVSRIVTVDLKTFAIEETPVQTEVSF